MDTIFTYCDHCPHPYLYPFYLYLGPYLYPCLYPYPYPYLYPYPDGGRSIVIS